MRCASLLVLALASVPGTSWAEEPQGPPPALLPEAPERLAIPCRALCGISIAGFSTMALGTMWFLWGGDSRGASDFGTIMVAGGATALVGSAAFGAGSLQTGLFDEGRQARGSTGLSLGLQPGGNTVLGESRPLRWLPEVTAMVRPGDRVALSAEVGARLGGTDVDLDPREGTGDQVALEHGATRGRVAMRARTLLGPVGGQQPVWIGVQPMVLHSSEAVVYTNGEALALERRALIAAGGASIDPLPGHRLTVYLGPRWDQTDWDLEGTGGRNGNWGPVYGEVSWRTADQQLLGGWLNLELEYVHSKFSGTGFKLAAMSGFFGPVLASADWRRSLGRGGWLLQLNLATELTEGDLTLRAGVLAPTRSP